MKLSEARILTLLKNTDRKLRFGKFISQKLDIDYKYTLEILSNMREKGWIGRKLEGIRFYYHTNTIAPIKEAKERIRQ